MPKMYDGPSVLWYLLKKIWKYYQNYQSASYDRTTEIENTRLAWEIQLAEACIYEKGKHDILTDDDKYTFQ